MIKDKIENDKIYYSLSDRIQRAFQWLREEDLINIPDGRYEVDGDNLYINVQTYKTKDDALYEAHRKYIDIQYMIAGSEKIGVTNYNNCTTEILYDESKDIEFLKCNQDESIQTLQEGEFLIFYPQDAHKPSIKYKENKLVKKAVAKVKI